jgi:hypothetical protein
MPRGAGQPAYPPGLAKGRGLSPSASVGTVAPGHAEGSSFTPTSSSGSATRADSGQVVFVRRDFGRTQHVLW